MASIYKRENGVWYIKYRRNGRWNYKSLKTGSKRQAEVEKQALEEKLAKEVAIQGVRASAGDIPWAETRLRPKTIESRQRALRMFQASCKAKTLSRVKDSDVDKYAKQRLKPDDSGLVFIENVDDVLTLPCLEQVIRHPERLHHWSLRHL